MMHSLMAGERHQGGKRDCGWREEVFLAETVVAGRWETASASDAQTTALARKDAAVRVTATVDALPASPTATRTTAGA